jgi:predicted dehydrogenase
MIGIGIIGLGQMGRYQAKSFAQVEGCRVVAGADPAAPCRSEFSKIVPDARVYANHRELLADKSVDAVVIVVPTAYHADLVIEALNGGRPVLVEKPMARTVEQCRRMNDAAQRANKVLMVAHCRRFDEDWGAFARAYREGRMGERILWRMVRGGIPYNRWFMDEELGGGPLFDGAIHNEDFGNYLFGMPTSVTGNSIKFDRTCTAIDTGNALIEYANGSQMLLSWSWAVNADFLHDALGEKSTFIFGSEGLSVPEGLKAHHLIDRAGNKTLVTFEPKDMYVTQAAHFLACVAGAEKCRCDGVEGMNAVAVGEAVLKACREGRKVEIR